MFLDSRFEFLLFIEDTYDRKSYVLGCLRIKGNNDYLNIAEVLTEMMKKYKIDISKFTHIITDNATNFGKLFKMFSISSYTIYQTNYVQNLGNFHEKDDLSSCESSDNEIDSDNSAIEINNVGSIFSTISTMEKENSDKLFTKTYYMLCTYITFDCNM
jgi:hypothetical protein